MHPQNQKLYEAMKAYVAAGLEFVSTRAKDMQEASGGDDFDFYWTLARYSEELSKVPYYESCLVELTSDTAIRPHLHENVGSYSRGTLTPDANGMMKQVLDLGRLDQTYEFNGERFNLEYARFEETYYSDTLLCEAIAPVQGLLLAIPFVQLSSDVEIRRLEQEEMRPYRAPDSQWDSQWCAIRVRYQVPKVIGDKDCDDRFERIEKEREIEGQANGKVEEVINAIRLLGKCDVYHSVIIHQTPKWLPIHDRTVPNRVLGTGLITYSFGDVEAESLKALWTRLQLAAVRKELAVAFRRFGDSCVRHRDEDKLIDLMIAAESLFLRGTKEGEKSFRLALRASQLLGTTGASKEIFERMRLAYHCRSVLAHGGSVTSDNKLKKLELAEFVGRIGDDIQAGILKAMNILASTGIHEKLDDDYWNTYLFGAEK